MKMRKVLALSVVVALLGSSFVGCGEKKEGPNPTTSAVETSVQAEATEAKQLDKEAVELNFYFPGDAPAGLQDVLDEFYKQTKNTINAKLNFNFTPWGEHANKIQIKIATGENVDSVFDAQWQSMPQMIAKKTYVNLDEYFLNDKYPGLKKAFDEQYVNNNKMQDENKEYHVYGIPFTRTYGMVQGAIVRKDLREKYGLPEIKSVADLETFFDAVLKNEGGKIVPFGHNGATSGFATILLNDWKTRNLISTVAVSNQFGIQTILQDNGKVIPFVTGENIPQLDSKYKNAIDKGMSSYEKAKMWYGKDYLEKDVMTQKDCIGFFKVGKYASIFSDTAQFNATYREVEKNVPGAKLEFAVLDQDIRDFKPGVIGTDFKAWNFACIPVNSQNIERTMMFFDWLFTNQANHDLIELGIEGKNWIKVGDDKFKIPDEVDATKNYNFPGYVLTWNPNYIRYPSDWSDQLIKYDRYPGDPNNCVKLPLTGFSFNAEPVKTEIAKVGPIAKQYGDLLELGLSKDVKGTVETMVEKEKQLGLEKIKQEVKKQVEEFLNSNKK